MFMRTHRWRWRFVAGMILSGLCVGGMLTATALAQPYGKEPGPFPAKKAAPIYTNKRAFKLPVTLPPEQRGKLQKMHLYVRTPQTEWSQYTSVSPMAEEFVYRAREDGEFWFLVATVGMDGRPSPMLSEVKFREPSLRVIIDTQAPTIDVQTSKSPDGNITLRCRMNDDNPNPASIRVVCKSTSSIERVVEAVDADHGIFRITPQEGTPLRVVGSDLCKNMVSQELHISELAGGADAGAGPGRDLSSLRPDFASLPPAQPGNSGTPIDPYDKRNDFAPVEINSTMPIQPVNPVRFPAPAPGLPLPMSGAPEAIPSIPLAGTVNTSASVPANRTILGSALATVEYRIDQQGPSGVGKVQIYITRDQGTTWQLLKEDVAKRSPVEIRLPGEGLFGINVVVANGNGFGGSAPRSGDAPSYWIEVDNTAPSVQFQPIDLLPDGAGLEIRWIASDKNLAAEPISLFYRNGHNGAWQPIVSGLKNEGRYRWTLPRNGATQFFFRIEAVDVAGNVGHVETPTPMIFDLTEPRGVVIRVIGSQRPGN